MATTIEIKTKSTRTRWVALALDNGSTILSEGVEPEVVIRKAKKTGKAFTIQFVPDPKSTYIL